MPMFQQAKKMGDYSNETPNIIRSTLQYNQMPEESILTVLTQFDSSVEFRTWSKDTIHEFETAQQLIGFRASPTSKKGVGSMGTEGSRYETISYVFGNEKLMGRTNIVATAIEDKIMIQDTDYDRTEYESLAPNVASASALAERTNNILQTIGCFYNYFFSSVEENIYPVDGGVFYDNVGLLDNSRLISTGGDAIDLNSANFDAETVMQIIGDGILKISPFNTANAISGRKQLLMVISQKNWDLLKSRFSSYVANRGMRQLSDFLYDNWSDLYRIMVLPNDNYMFTAQKFLDYENETKTAPVRKFVDNVLPNMIILNRSEHSSRTLALNTPSNQITSVRQENGQHQNIIGSNRVKMHFTTACDIDPISIEDQTGKGIYKGVIIPFAPEVRISRTMNAELKKESKVQEIKKLQEVKEDKKVEDKKNG